MSETTKICHGFGKEPSHPAGAALPVSSFGKNASRPDGRSAYCKRCNAASQKAWREAHPEKVKAQKKHYRALEAAY